MLSVLSSPVYSMLVFLLADFVRLSVKLLRPRVHLLQWFPNQGANKHPLFRVCQMEAGDVCGAKLVSLIIPSIRMHEGTWNISLYEPLLIEM